MIFILRTAKIVKGIKNIFSKHLARKKNLCIFALGFGTAVSGLDKIF